MDGNGPGSKGSEEERCRGSKYNTVYYFESGMHDSSRVMVEKLKRKVGQAVAARWDMMGRKPAVE